ncbi:alpha/beta fold hydrolase [Pusillimonas sp. TS35]|uniref:alpha/beta fold hydrolase n=1 Tax=Paracandidimonas lactea TaxID=2895524 RepID=UPI00136B5EAD|nr:alpha/beta hydrolase [Paracandidimonas lactea]MYN14875.1 alpha/beta fold hydrolase [Pusillimonas sp. TS35]
MHPGATAQFPPPDHIYSLADHTVHYAETGQGIPLVLVHGSLCDYRYWRWQFPALGQRWHVVAPSLRGYWPQALPQPDPLFSIAQHADDLAAFIRAAFGGQPVHLLGHSRGAQVAFETALRAPGSIRSLMLADPGFRLEGEPEKRLIHGEMADLMAAGDADAALAGFVDNVNGPGTWRQMTGWFKDMVHDNSATLLSQARESHPAVSTGQMRSLRCPLLLIGGANSAPRYQSRLDALQAAVPAARRVTIRMAAHGMNLANPRAFNAAVGEFMEQVQASKV